MQLHPVNRLPKGNRFCGPAVISVLTKMNTDEAAKLIRHVSGQRKVTGTRRKDLIKAFNLCGINSVSHQTFSYMKPKQRPTITKWLSTSKSLRTPGRVWLVVAGNHYQLVSGRKFVCGLTSDIVSIKDEKVKRRARVSDVYELTASQIVIPQEARLVKPVYNPTKNKAKRLAEKYKIEIDTEGEDAWFVYAPDESFENEECDPYYDNHYCHSWEEVLEHVETYVEYLK